MELTGKCKEEFDKWYINNHCKDLTVPNLIKLELRLFNSMHDSMKYGVYVDYFDSEGMMLEVSFYWGAKYWNAEISMFKEDGSTYLEYSSNCNYEVKTRQQARTEAIKKANELRNEQLNGL